MLNKPAPPDLDIFNLPVHPAAHAYPLLPPDELEELTASIAEQGLKMPLVVQRIEGEWTLIDGRNRREACRTAGVTPTIHVLSEQEDASAYIVAANGARRNITKGQKAMAVALIFPDPEARGRGKKSVLKTDFSVSQLRHARTVLSAAPELAEQVRDGAMPLNDAYQEAQRRKAEADSDIARFAKLQENAPDLAELVKEERLPLREAMSALAEAFQQQPPTLDLTAELSLTGFSAFLRERLP